MSDSQKKTNRYLPSTLQLFQLRNAVINSDENDEICSQFLTLRNNVAKRLHEKKLLAAAEPYFFDAFDAFSKLPSHHEFFLPPLYKSDHLRSILQSGIKSLLLREVGEINGSDNNVGHLVLGGVEGAGKTTLMRALALGAAALLKKMIPICHDYLDFKTPQEVIWEALKIYHSRESADQEEPLDVLNNSLNQEAFLLLDEFQHNFCFQGDPHEKAGKHAAITFHRYSRTSGTFGVIGGSSVDMHLLMFKHGSGEDTDHWRKRGYPDFNGTLYELHTVPALRSVQELEAYIRVRYPLWGLSEEEVSRLLAYTGGIGRLVHKVWTDCRYCQELTETDDRYHLCTEDRLRPCTSYRKISYDRFLEKPENRQLIAYLLLTAQPENGTSGYILNCGGVYKTLLLLALEKAGVESPIAVVREAQALSVIYIDMDSYVQFSHPIDAAIYSKDMQPLTHRLLLLSAVHLMVCGCTDDNGDVTDVNAGNALEELVRNNVFKGACINEHALLFRPDAILVIENKTMYLYTNSVKTRFTVEILKSLNLKHISWRKEHGLDGFCFEEDASSPDSWFLDLWQCKGGRHDVKIGGGNNSMNTALANYKKNRFLKDVGDQQITEIVLKAQVGICLIVVAMRSAIPGVIIKPRRLVITTTKQCRQSCIQTVNSWEENGGVIIEEDILTHFELNSGSIANKALKSKFQVKIESGCEWVIESIPESALRGAASQMLEPLYTGITNVVQGKDDIASRRRSSSRRCIVQ